MLFLLSESFIDPIIEKYWQSLVYSLLAKLLITLLLKPIEGLIERILLNRIVKRRQVKSA